jgi:putative ATP-binding cassette transporter
MSDVSVPSPNIEDRRLRIQFWRMMVGFWRGPTARQAWTLTLALLALILIAIAVQYGLNRWNRYFFDALESKDAATASHAVVLFLGICAVAILVAVAQNWTRMTLQAHWRRWTTATLAGEWLKDRHFYQLSIAAPEVDSPEFRMTDDVRIAVDPVVDLGVGLVNAALTAAVFVGVLWSVGGAVSLFGFSIPGGFVAAAALYGAANSLLMLSLGKPLISTTASKNAAEAQNRFELVRIRENAESIALIGGEDDERRTIETTLGSVLARWAGVIRQQSLVVFIVHGNVMLAPVLPLLIGAPKYLAGEMTLGNLMQLAAAFVQTQVAFNWLVDNFVRLAEWRASAGRVVELWLTLAAFRRRQDSEERIARVETEGDAVEMTGLSVSLHNGKVVIRDADASIRPGEKVLIKGASGTGKSTLIRAIAGLWPWGSGRIALPARATLLFQPQKPYIPLGSLRNALLYPAAGVARDNAEIAAAMTRCGLRSFIGRLDEEQRWDRILSGGQQQRLGFARLLLQRPDIVILDEATSALDEESQQSLMELFRRELSAVTLISVGHRPGLEEFHDRVVELALKSDGAMMVEADPVTEEKRQLRFLARVLRRAARRVGEA